MGSCIGIEWALIVQGNAGACDLMRVLWEGPEVMSVSINECIHIPCAVAHKRNL